jgi:uncharacterized protein (TIGR02300 family)
MTKPELGTKRLCTECNARYYDLNTTPTTCPKCGARFQVIEAKIRPRSGPPAAVRQARSGGAKDRIDGARSPGHGD